MFTPTTPLQGSLVLPNLPCLKRNLWRAVSGHAPDLRTLATRSWVLCPSERSTCAKAIYPEGSLERVTGLSPWGTWRHELAMIRGESIEHAASMRYEILDATLRGPVVYRGAAKEQAGYGAERWLCRVPEPCVTLPTGHLVSSAGGSSFFGMYMRADLPMAMWAEEPAERLWLPTKPYAHQQGYRHLLALDGAAAPAYARISRLFVYTDFGHNASKQRRFQELRARLRHGLRGRACDAPAGIYIRRGEGAGQRRLLNEAAIEDLLQRGGFRVIDPSVTSAEDIARQSLDARVIVAVEGSHLAHAIYSASEDATFLVLQPPDRFSMAYKAYTDCLGMRFAFVVGDASAAGFAVRLDEIETVLAGTLR